MNRNRRSLALDLSDPDGAAIAERLVTDSDAAPEARLGQGTVEKWRARLQAAGVPCAPVQAAAQVFADPHLRARAVRG